MRFRLALARCDLRLAGAASGLATFARTLAAMAVRSDLVVHRPQVRIRMVIPGAHMVHRVRARTATEVTDALVIAQNPLALGMPFLGQPDPARRPFPLSGSHAYTSWI